MRSFMGFAGRRAVSGCLLLLAWANTGSAAPPEPASARAGEPGVRYRLQAADGSVAAEGALDRSQPAVAIAGLGGGARVATFSPQSAETPTRMLVRLHGEPLVRFVDRERRRIVDAGRAPSPAQRDALARLEAVHAAALQRAQQDLGTELRTRGLVEAVHGGFTTLTNTLVVTMRARDLDALRRDPRVASVYPDNVVRTTLATSVPLIHAPALWAMQDPDGDALTGGGIRIAILDTGIDYRHPDLGGCFGVGCKVVDGYDFVGLDADPLDDHGHGTHVAGIAAANGVLRGVAPEATLLAYKVLDAAGFGNDSQVIAGLERAVDPDQDPLTDDRADVINLSLGGGGGPDAPLSEAADNAVLAGSVVVAAAGNAGPYGGSIGSPGNAEHAISVAASEGLDRIADFSSRGPVAGRDYVKPDLAAPGAQILSMSGPADYQRLSGTSMAAPHVAGGAALLRQRDPAASPVAIRDRLVAGTRDVGAPVYAQGAGVIDLLASVEATLMIEPAQLAFGAVDGSQAVWQSTRTLRLRNIGSGDEQIALTLSEGLPAGAQLSFVPANPFTLGPGQSREVIATLSVDTATVPYPESDTLHFEADIVSNTATELRVPVLFRRFEALEFEVEGAPGRNHIVHLRRRGEAGFYLGAYGDDLDTDHRFELRPGSYSIETQLWTGDAWGTVFRGPFEVPGPALAPISYEEAVHRVHVSSLADESGTDPRPSALIEYQVFEAIDSATNSASYFIVLQPGESLFRVSDLPDFIAARTTSSILDLRSPLDEQVRYLLSDARAPGEPIKGDWDLSLDARESGKARFSYRDFRQLGLEPTSIQAEVAMLSSQQRGGFRGLGMAGGFGPTTDAVDLTVFAPLSGTTLDRPFVDMAAKIDAFPEPNTVGWTPVAASGLLGFPEAGRYMAIEHIDWNTGDLLETTAPRGPGLVIDDGPTYFASRFHFQWPRDLVAFNGEISVFRPVLPLWKDSLGNEFPLDVDYALTCADGASTTSGRLDRSVFVFAAIAVPAACDGSAIDLRLNQSVDVLDTGIPSEIRVRMRAFGDAWIPAPHLEELVLLDDGIPSRLLESDRPQVRLRWLPAYFDGAPQVALDYRLDGDATWTPLALQHDADGAIAALPVLPSAQLASLRVTLTGSQGDFEQQALEAMFLLGRPTVHRDGFEAE